MAALYCGIVVDHHYPIARGVDIELYGVGPQLQRFHERGNRVFGKQIVCSPVRDALGNSGAGSLGQAGLMVVALETMNAKL